MNYKPFTTEYTWQIIDDIKEYLEETNKDQTTLDTLDLCHLIGEIEELNDKNRELFNKNKQSKIHLQQKENIIDKLEKELEDMATLKTDEYGNARKITHIDINWLLKKIKELKGDDKNDKS